VSDAKWATDRLAEVHRRAASCDEAQIDGATRAEFEARFHRRFPVGEPLVAGGGAPPLTPAAAPSAAGELVTRESPPPVRRVPARPAVETPVSATTATADGAGARLKTIVHPIYPRAALQARVGGVVILRVIVSEEGEPVQVDVVQGVRPDLNAAAVSAIKRCLFEPGRVDGRPVRSSTTVSVPFQP
jgi:TonB family protein